MTTSPPTDMNPAFDVRIPKSRIAVLIGNKGETKAKIESEAKVKLDVDSHEGDVTITGEDAVMSFVARDIVKAIGRGFNPEFALQLLKPDYALELIDLGENVKSKNQQLRLKGRVIGKEGKSRMLIEKYMEVHISVFGKTIGILGEIERVTFAKQAVEMLIDGSPHANVYRWLEKKRKSIVREELSGSSIEVKEEFEKYM